MNPSRIDATVTRALRGILVFAILGAGTELLLLGHYEDAWQWTPIALLAVGLVVIGWHWMAPGAVSTHVLRITMVVFMSVGVLGAFLHYRGNVEFELEMYPSLRGFALVREAMTGATPALAPGTMIVLGLLGLVYSIRYPTVSGGHPETPNPRETGDATRQDV